MSENVEFITISDLPDKECDNQNSLVSLIFFTLHVASLGTALPDEFGNFSRFLSFLCLTTHSIFAPAPTSPTVRQCHTGRVNKNTPVLTNFQSCRIESPWPPWKPLVGHASCFKRPAALILNTSKQPDTQTHLVCHGIPTTGGHDGEEGQPTRFFRGNVCASQLQGAMGAT